MVCKIMIDVSVSKDITLMIVAAYAFHCVKEMVTPLL